ncbi:cysteine desulfurase family protein [Fictibacillus aquaticus]|uniref:Cysteine desulfurase NifS n=1 Tax=Fictibacillus aquaticus TaxID=2021314 RepID=A0A235FB25_9BACL|nr:cysteine desulfurase family protein [Fictibacillus aquaticus]OYD58214.1 cysteine desulfurase NifS [Fictibacillus aquaticus]
MIYFDNSATTRPYEEVVQTFAAVSKQYFANPSSLHAKGGEAERLLNKARQNIAAYMDAEPSEIIFTSGGTEGNNIAIKGSAIENKERGMHLITTMTEHASVYETFNYLESIGFSVTYLNVNSNGQISLEELENSITDKTTLVSILHVNNETGAVQPVEEIGKILAAHPKIIYHVDHVQGVGKVPLDLKRAGIDLCTISGHKFHGLKGTGALYVRSGIRLSPLFTGGEQEGRIRAGTENVAGIVSLAKAMRMTLDEAKQKGSFLKEIHSYLYNSLSSVPGIAVNSPQTGAAPHILNFSIDGIKPEVFIHTLEEQQIYVSTRSACSSKKAGASRILLAMGIKDSLASSAIRISLSYENTMHEAEIVVETIKKAVKNLKEVMR